MKIRAIITDQTKIWRILRGIGWTTEAFDFDPSSDFSDCEICQLVPGMPDGFPTVDESSLFESDPDPPHCAGGIDPPHWDDSVDPPHLEDANCIIYNN
jgi:hypothetical protein